MRIRPWRAKPAAAHVFLSWAFGAWDFALRGDIFDFFYNDAKNTTALVHRALPTGYGQVTPVAAAHTRQRGGVASLH
jgi:hypothetical protein